MFFKVYYIRNSFPSYNSMLPLAFFSNLPPFLYNTHRCTEQPSTQGPSDCTRLEGDLSCPLFWSLQIPLSPAAACLLDSFHPLHPSSFRILPLVKAHCSLTLSHHPLQSSLIGHCYSSVVPADVQKHFLARTL